MNEPDLVPDCGRIQNELAAFLYHELAPEARASTARHLEACPACREDLAALEETRGLLSRWETPPSGDDAGTLARSLAEQAGRDVARAGRRARLLRWSAAVSGAAAAALFTLSLLGTQVSYADGRLLLSFALPGAGASGPLAPGWQEEVRAIAAEEAALRTAGLERGQGELLQRCAELQDQDLRLSQAVDYAFARNQEVFDTRLVRLGREAARADLETRRALTEVAAYLPVSNPAPR